MSRLLINRFGEGNMMLGNMVMAITIGSPIIVGVMKEENKFSFIFFLKVLWILIWILVLAQGSLESCILLPLVEI